MQNDPKKIVSEYTKNSQYIVNCFVVIFLLFVLWLISWNKDLSGFLLFGLCVTTILFVVFSVRNAVLKKQITENPEIKSIYEFQLKQFDLQNAEKNKDLSYLKDQIVENNFPKAETNKNVAFLIIDTETTGLPVKRGYPPECTDLYPYVAEIAWLSFNINFELIDEYSSLVKIPIAMPFEASIKNKINDDILQREGKEPLEVLEKFIEVIKKSEYVITHNIWFDIPVIESNFIRYGFGRQFNEKKLYCTMMGTIDFCKIPRKKYDYNSEYKYPKLDELVSKCFHFYPPHYLQHRAYNDTVMTAKCFRFLLTRNLITLEKLIKIPQQLPDHPLYNKVVVFNGFTQSESSDLERKILNIGGKIEPNITNETDYLFVEFEKSIQKKTSQKITKAQKMQEKGHRIKIMTDYEYSHFFTQHDFTYY